MNTQNAYDGRGRGSGRPVPLPPSTPPKPTGMALLGLRPLHQLLGAPGAPLCPVTTAPTTEWGCRLPLEACQAFLLSADGSKATDPVPAFHDGPMLCSPEGAELGVGGRAGQLGTKGTHTSCGHWGSSLASALQILEDSPGPGVTRHTGERLSGILGWQPDALTRGFRPSSSPRTWHRAPGESVFKAQRFSKVGEGW